MENICLENDKGHDTSDDIIIQDIVFMNPIIGHDTMQKTIELGKKNISWGVNIPLPGMMCILDLNEL